MMQIIYSFSKMLRYMKYGPYVCITVVLFILFVLWALCGGQEVNKVGLPPDSCASTYNWASITPTLGYNPISGENCVPSEVVCQQESSVVHSSAFNSPIPYSPVTPASGAIIDYTPHIATQYKSAEVNPLHQEQLAPPVSPEEKAEVIVEPAEETEIPKPSADSQSATLATAAARPPVKSRRGKFISRGERLCCQTMERIYGVPFRSIWPNWLVNPETGEKLELDCYNDDLKIAVEYNGEQHYNFPNFTNQTEKQFINQVRRDALKRELCDRNGVYLIVVPYNVAHERIPEFIMSYLPETIKKRLEEEKILANMK